jgi:coatomer protein complex subunit gamma
LTIKELSRKSQDIIIVTSSLTQDINNSKLDSVYKASAIRALGTVIDGTMVQSVERFIKTAMVDRNPIMSSAALVTGIHLFEVNKEAVRRWQSDVQQALSLAPQKSTVQYHALALSYLVKQHDRMAVLKLIQQMQSSASNPLSACLFLKIYGSIIAKEASVR